MIFSFTLWCLSAEIQSEGSSKFFLTEKIQENGILRNYFTNNLYKNIDYLIISSIFYNFHENSEQKMDRVVSIIEPIKLAQIEYCIFSYCINQFINGGTIFTKVFSFQILNTYAYMCECVGDKSSSEVEHGYGIVCFNEISSSGGEVILKSMTITECSPAIKLRYHNSNLEVYSEDGTIYIQGNDLDSSITMKDLNGTLNHCLTGGSIGFIERIQRGFINFCQFQLCKLEYSKEFGLFEMNDINLMVIDNTHLINCTLFGVSGGNLKTPLINTFSSNVLFN